MKESAPGYWVLALTLIASLIWWGFVFGPNVIGKWSSTCLPVAQHGISPKGWYSVQTCFWDWDYEAYYGYFKLYDNRTGKLIAESDFGTVMGNSRIFWPSKSKQRFHVGVGGGFCCACGTRAGITSLRFWRAMMKENTPGYCALALTRRNRIRSPVLQ